MARHPPVRHRAEAQDVLLANDRNQKLYQQDAALAKNEPNTIFGGRLAECKYYDMDDVIKSALERAGGEL